MGFNDARFRRIIEAAYGNVAGDGDLVILQGFHHIDRNKIIGAYKSGRHLFHLFQPLLHPVGLGEKLTVRV